MADTHSTVVDKNGEQKELPATFLTLEEADLLREYQRWGASNHLCGTMKCRYCGGDVEVFVQDKIGLFCGCRVLVWQPS